MGFLMLVVAISAVGISFVLLRHRQPTSIESSIADFEQGLRAIAPEAQLNTAGAPHHA
ncbi:MAG: hypothetical protein ACOYNI_05745 [Acidimicrobiia bacterium]